ncbi:uncharacterized protein LOC120115027 [Hibiscus syriacus]|uniref:uncharacterized protein LOC120115027 n=1 Tax=Hibiscus syriacus TaxID=106335 RepID=UPI0019222C42|nr:uncharacterized protein LOC120115027 [Hibiscus syriacus]
MPQPHHFNDYGFDPQIHHFQVLEGSRKHKKETTSTVDGVVQFKLQKPFSEDYQSNRQKAKTKRYWWRNALFFFGRKKRVPSGERNQLDDDRVSAKASRGLILGPLYMTERGGSGSTTPCRPTSQSHSGPLAGISTPYVSLKELNMEQQPYRVSTSSLPIYFVT